MILLCYARVTTLFLPESPLAKPTRFEGYHFRAAVWVGAALKPNGPPRVTHSQLENRATTVNPTAYTRYRYK
jgi:hypothetical protein